MFVLRAGGVWSEEMVEVVWSLERKENITGRLEIIWTCRLYL
jgi:hypothetical protein